ncbi:Rieske (2Fe-2S) protein [Saliphagus sp. GCM10025334]
MTKVAVAGVTEFESGDRKIVETDDGEIGVFNVDNIYYAIRNKCPHQCGPICTGKVSGALVGEWPGIGERVTERFDDEPAVTCPWHGWDFYLDTGTHVGDPSISVKTYPVSVEDDTVYVEIADK